MPAKHRYVVADPVTDRPLGVLPLSGVGYSRRIGTPGEFNATLPIVNPAVGEIARQLTRQPLALYVERVLGSRRNIWWGGLVWLANPAKGRRGATSCPITGATFESYPESRRIWADVEFDDIDRGHVFADLLEHMQTQPGNASIGLDVPAVTIGGEHWFTGWTMPQNASYSEALAQVAAMDPSFEWTIDVYADPDGIRRRRVRFGTPLLGNPDARNLLASPDTIVSWSLTGDNKKNGTHGLARGAAVAKNVAGEVVPITSSVAVNETAIADGALRVDVFADYDETDEANLPVHADALVRRTAPVPSVTVQLPDESPLHPGMIGDMGRVVINDWTFPGGRFDQQVRLIGVKVKPAERGQAEEVTFEFQAEEGEVSAA